MMMMNKMMIKVLTSDQRQKYLQGVYRQLEYHVRDSTKSNSGGQRLLTNVRVFTSRTYEFPTGVTNLDTSLT